MPNCCQNCCQDSSRVFDPCVCAPGRTRTLNRPGRNRLLYPLSYGRLVGKYRSDEKVGFVPLATRHER